MKIKFLIIILFLLSTKIFAQDTIRDIDGIIHIYNNSKSNITDKIQQLKFMDLNNNNILLDSNNAKCIVINLWATWCHPCVAEIPAFNLLMTKYKDCNVDFYGLSYTEDSSSTNIFLKSRPFNFKQIIASREYIKNNKLSNGLPTTLFIDKKGNVLFKITGGNDDPNKQEETINKFINGMKTIGCP